MFDYRAAATRLRLLRLRDLWLRPGRVLEDAYQTGLFAERLRNRHLESFFANDTQLNRLARDGFFDGVAAVRVGSVVGQISDDEPLRPMLRIDFVMADDENVAARALQLQQIVRDFTGMIEDA